MVFIVLSPTPDEIEMHKTVFSVFNLILRVIKNYIGILYGRWV